VLQGAHAYAWPRIYPSDLPFTAYREGQCFGRASRATLVEKHGFIALPRAQRSTTRWEKSLFRWTQPIGNSIDFQSSSLSQPPTERGESLLRLPTAWFESVTGLLLRNDPLGRGCGASPSRPWTFVRKASTVDAGRRRHHRGPANVFIASMQGSDHDLSSTFNDAQFDEGGPFEAELNERPNAPR